MSPVQAVESKFDQSAVEEETSKLLIAIPALNEEQSIASIIERSLDARAQIVENSPVDEVEITVVSDGSDDRTVEIAGAYRDRINLIVFEKNRGYGAAIKEAWNRSDATLLGFLDADGTCDPRFFTQLCNKLEEDDADVVLGCRMNRDSEMPLVRKAGNLVFATLLTVFSSTRVRDSASGMRVVRRSSLKKLYPLPDGLHFTPAMSARAVLSSNLRIAEVDMPYREREGESKLKVGKDGLRFLRVILSSAFLYTPSRLFTLLGLLLFIVASALMVPPTDFYLRNRFVEEWMIYRFIVSDLLGTSAILLLCAAHLSQKIVQISLAEPAVHTPSPTAVFFRSRFFWIVPAVLLVAGSLLVASSFIERVSSGVTYEHWSRFVAMSFLVGTAVILITTRILDYVLRLVRERLAYLKDQDG